MARIEKLTPAQVAKFPAYVAEWTGYGLSTEPADRPRAEAAIRRMYRDAGLEVPRIIWCDSPLSMALTKAALRSAWASVRGSVGDSVRDSVWASVRASVRGSVRDSVRDSVWASVRDSVGDSVRDSVWASVRASVRGSVRDSVRASVWDSVYGQHEAAFLAFHRFFQDECGLKEETRALTGLWDLCKSCGWIMPYKGICLASERHNVCRLNDSGVIHCENGPAIAYPDGFEIYAFNGVVLPKKWVTERESIDPSEVLSEPDVEKRAAGAACIGWDRMLSRLDHNTLDDTGNPDHGKLIEVRLPGLPQPGRFLVAECPRNGRIFEGVPPEIDTTLAAQAWRVGKSPENFTYPERRT